MTTTKKTTTANETGTKKSSSELRAALADAEHARRVAAKMLDNGEPGGAEAHQAAHADVTLLSDWLVEAAERERKEQDVKTAGARKETSARLAKEASEWSLERRNRFRDEIVEEGLELERRLVALWQRQDAKVEEARAARARIEEEAAAAGVPAPPIPVWAGFTSELAAAIAQAHDRRRPDTSGLPREVRALTEGRTAAIAERARGMLVPWRGHVRPAADPAGPEEERAS